ncbi:hypothetical protein PQU92_15010 [Asticcacaulis sp. BYS171W]|uniref:Uncharacterized protein n=1 Tax=Asticcacaulis aquaticus TaxID=2984212 RepID=A0ABT5HXC5_9CAUL|nr:hypothetical protein [Asticcacaulis aquaticus]MDC7684593.1 hypothetical protein [Asticcacaulis aquaticus]
MRTLPLIAAALLIATPIAAQESKTVAKTPAASDDTKEQTAKVQAVLADFDKKVMAGFQGEDKLLAAMQADLKAIETQKDPKARAAAITAYQKKYADSYRNALKKGGADIGSLASVLSQILGGRTFKVVDGTHLVAVTDNGETPPAPPPAPAKQTITLGSSDFTFSQSGSCAGIRDSDSSYANFRVRTYTWAGVAGGCEEKGTLNYIFAVVDGLNPTARVKFDLTAEASAAAAGGAAWSKGISSMTVFGGPTPLVRSLTIDVVAAVMWAAEDDGEVQNAVMTVTAGRNRGLMIQGQSISRANAVGLAAGTESSSSVKIQEASVVANP